MTAPRHLRPKQPRHHPFRWAAAVVVFVLFIAGLHAYVVEVYVIPSGSMEPTIKIGDRVVANKLSYDFGGHPRTGEIAVFASPPGFFGPTYHDLIKRVIGTPGESLRSGRDGTIYIDGRLLAQPWLTAGAKADPGPALCSLNLTDCVGAVLHLPANRYLVMGDNRGDSVDGRAFGPISSGLFVARAVVRVWPLSRLHVFAWH